MARRSASPARHNPGYGFLPFGSSSSDVVWASSLLSEASVTAAGGTVIGGTFHPVRGFNPGSGGGVRFPSGASSTALTAAGQLRFEIERELLCELDATNNQSDGATLAGNQFAITFRDTDAVSTPYGRVYRNSGGQMNTAMNSADGNQGYKLSTLVHDTYMTVEIEWDGAVYSLYVDGIAAVRKRAYTSFTDMFAFVWVGCDRGNGLAVEDYYIRNVQIASVAPVWITCSETRIHWFGDSFVNLGTTTYITDRISSATPQYQGKCDQITAGWLRRRGFDWQIEASGHSAHFISDTGADPLVDEVAALLATSPTYVFFRAGTNDGTAAGGPNADVQSSLESMLDTIMAAESVVGCVVGTVPLARGGGEGNTEDAAIKSVNTSIRAAVTSWRNANPTKGHRLIIADYFAAMGGDTIPKDNIIGLRSGAHDNLHPSARGQRIMVESYCEALTRLPVRNTTGSRN
jgi:lysophospholipase L1-like esterase